ncbi:MAG: hypothetical protein WBC91_06300 [Phototrophicaceae bacterium]
MNIHEEMQRDAKLWEDYLLSWTESQQALLRLYHGVSNRVEFMRDQFEENAHHPILWDMLMMMPSQELLQVANILVKYAAHPSWGFNDNVHDVIRRIPEPWLVDHLWELTEPYLDENHPDADERIWGLLSLYSEIDLSLTARLAQYAARSNNKDMVEAGEAWLARIKNDIPLL